MSHYLKDFSNYSRDYRIQESAGIPEVVPLIVPVTIVDDVSEYVTRTRPRYQGRPGAAAVAAVYSMVGLEATTLPVRINQARIYVHNAADVQCRITTTDLRTANQGTASGVGLNRGQAASTATMLTGTAATETVIAFTVYRAAITRFMDDVLDGLVLRPGEIAWFMSGTANTALNMNFDWDEWRFPLPADPPNLR